ncbi:hypothetical protein MTO96_038595 [Rhipicephalus appendiculatus]
MNDLLTLGTIHDVHKQAKDIIKYVKKTHVVLATFKERQQLKYGKSMSCSLKLPSKTRWSGVCLSFESLLKNKEVLQEIAIMEKLKFDKTLMLVVLDEEEFWVALKSCHTLLEPIAKAIKAVESDGALLSDVINLFHNLAEEIHSKLQCSVLSQSERDLVEKALKRRKEFTVHPVHCAANLLDPRHKGKNLTDEEVLLAFDWISEHSTHMNLEVVKVYSDVAEYRTNAGIWSRPGIWASANHMPPSTWWEGICTSKTVMPLARNVLQIPPSSAACERNWSDFANIHTLRRNRLRSRTVEKLVFVLAHLNMMKKATD